MGKSLCSKCVAEQQFSEIKIPIRYSFNGKEAVLINGIERVCTVCGWHVDDIETTDINRKIALKALETGEGLLEDVPLTTSVYSRSEAPVDTES